MSLQVSQMSMTSSLGTKGRFGSFSSASYSGSSIRSSSKHSSASMYGTSYGRTFGGYGYRGAWLGSGHPVGTVSMVTVNQSLLEPLDLNIDRDFCTVRTQEKDQIKSLNNRFASIIDKVQSLEQQRKMLETKWELLKNETVSSSTIGRQYEGYITELRCQLDVFSNKGVKLETELQLKKQEVEELKKHCEDEIRMRCNLEDKLMLLKKDVDKAYLENTDLEEKLVSLSNEIVFLRTVYEEEIKELEASIKDVSVIVEMDKPRSVNMDNIVAEVKAQHEHIASRNREEVELWYKGRYNQMSSKATQYDDELRVTKSELAELRRKISRLQTEIETIKEQRLNLEGLIKDTKAEEEKKLKKARRAIQELEETLKKHKHDMALLVKNHQELLNTKLGLDIEIATYRSLLEEEEYRIGNQHSVNIHHVASTKVPDVIVSSKVQKTGQKYLIKLTETENVQVTYK